MQLRLHRIILLSVSKDGNNNSNYVYSEQNMKVIIKQLKRSNKVFSLGELEFLSDDLATCLFEGGYQIKELFNCSEILEGFSNLWWESPLKKAKQVIDYIKGTFGNDFDFESWLTKTISPTQMKKLAQIGETDQENGVCESVPLACCPIGNESMPIDDGNLEFLPDGLRPDPSK